MEQRRNDLSEEYSQDSEMESDPSVTWRPRRALSSEYFIEIMVAADAEMKRYHGEGLLHYILVLMSTVRLIFFLFFYIFFIFLLLVVIIRQDNRFHSVERLLELLIVLSI